ncbi:MAG TPA: hypothetical protein VHF69_08835 [Candidatus Synoicihabitans sp.]|nr:hypothetical protein [Candidatus Synoicihabitans sp.]
MPKKKTSLPRPATQHDRRPRGGATTRTRADASVDAGTTLRRSKAGGTRPRALARLAKDAKAPLEAPLRTSRARVGTPKRKNSPAQLQAKARRSQRRRQSSARAR